MPAEVHDDPTWYDCTQCKSDAANFEMRGPILRPAQNDTCRSTSAIASFSMTQFSHAQCPQYVNSRCTCAHLYTHVGVWSGTLTTHCYLEAVDSHCTMYQQNPGLKSKLCYFFAAQKLTKIQKYEVYKKSQGKIHHAPQPSIFCDKFVIDIEGELAPNC